MAGGKGTGAEEGTPFGSAAFQQQLLSELNLLGPQVHHISCPLMPRFLQCIAMYACRPLHAHCLHCAVRMLWSRSCCSSEHWLNCIADAEGKGCLVIGASGAGNRPQPAGVQPAAAGGRAAAVCGRRRRAARQERREPRRPGSTCVPRQRGAHLPTLSSSCAPRHDIAALGHAPPISRRWPCSTFDAECWGMRMLHVS